MSEDALRRVWAEHFPQLELHGSSRARALKPQEKPNGIADRLYASLPILEAIFPDPEEEAEKREQAEREAAIAASDEAAKARETESDTTEAAEAEPRAPSARFGAAVAQRRDLTAELEAEVAEGAAEVAEGAAEGAVEGTNAEAAGEGGEESSAEEGAAWAAEETEGAPKTGGEDSVSEASEGAPQPGPEEPAAEEPVAEEPVAEEPEPIPELPPEEALAAWRRIAIETPWNGDGEDYRGVLGRLGTPVQLKVLAAARGEFARRDFVLEFAAPAHLRHPVIPQVLAFGRSENGDVYVARDARESESWIERLAHGDGVRAAEREAWLADQLRVWLAVCDAVTCAHERGLIHGDLRASHVRIGRFGEVFLDGWGLAVDVSEEAPPVEQRAWVHRSEVQGPRGTPGHMAPEQAAGRVDEWGPATDVYLLGATLYEVLAGRPPHRAKTLFETILAAHKPEPLSFPKGVPVELQQLCAKAMAGRPKDRFASVVELQREARAFLSHWESIKIADRALKRLKRLRRRATPEGFAAFDPGERESCFTELTEIAASFRQARALWRHNTAAHKGEQSARKTHAELAVVVGDWDTAEAQATDLSDARGGDAIRRQIGEARELLTVAAAKKRRRSALARVGLASLAFIIGGGAVFGALTGGVLKLGETTPTARTAAPIDKGLVERARHQMGAAFAFRARQLAEEGRAFGARMVAMRALGELPTSEEAAEGERGEPLWPRLSPEVNGGAVARARSVALGARGARPLWASPLPIEGGRFQVAISPDSETIAVAGADGNLRLWSRDGGALLRSIKAHRGAITGLAFSKDGKRLVSVGEDKLGRVWDPATGALVHKLTGSTAGLRCLAVSSKNIVAAGSLDEQAPIVLWSLDSGLPVRTIAEAGAVVGIDCLAFSNDGELLASASGPQVRVWSVADARLTARLKSGYGNILSLSFSPVGAYLAAGQSGKTVSLWDVKDVKLVTELKGHSDWVTAVAFSPAKSPTLLSGCKDGSIRVWDLGDKVKKLKFELKGHGSAITRLSIAADHRWLVSGAEGGVRVWDLRSGRAAPMAVGHSGSIIAQAFDPEGLRLATAGEDRLVHIWKAADGDRLATLTGHRAAVRCLAWSQDGALLVTGGADRQVRVWRGDTGAPVEDFTWESQGALKSVAFSADARFVLGTNALGQARAWDRKKAIDLSKLSALAPAALSPSGALLAAKDASRSDKQVIALWDLSTGAKVKELDHGPALIADLAFSPDGARLVTAASDKRARVWELKSGRMEGELPAQAPLAFHPKGELLVARDLSGALAVWSLKARRIIRALATGTFLGLSPDGRRLAIAEKGELVSLWELQGGALAARLPGQAPLAFAPDGRSLAVTAPRSRAVFWRLDAQPDSPAADGSSAATRLKAPFAQSADGRWLAGALDARSIGVLDRKSGALRWTLKGHGGALRSLAFGGSGRVLVSAALDKTARLWDLETGKERRAFTAGAPLFCAAIAPDERRIAAGGMDRKIYLWDADSGAIATADKQPIQAHAREVGALIFHPNAPSLISAGLDGAVLSWDLKTFQRARAYRESSERAASPAAALAVSADGALVAAAVGEEEVVVWKTASGELVVALEAGLRVAALSFDPTGPRLAAAGASGELAIFDLPEGRLYAELGCGRRRVSWLAYSPDGARLLAGGGAEPVAIITARPPRLAPYLAVGSFDELDFALDRSRRNLYGGAGAWRAVREDP